MHTDTLCEIIDAAHLTKNVQSVFGQRGGLLIVAPPGSLKTSILEYVLDEYPNTFVLSDTNMTQLENFREDMISNRYSTMAFPEFQKVYARDQRTASSVESTIAALVDEGWRRPSFRDPRAGALRSRMLVIAGMTPTFYERHFDAWQRSGFLRRFIVSLFSVENPELITDAIKDNTKLGLNGIPRKAVTANGIPFHIEPPEANFCHKLLKEQPDDKTPLILLMRIFAVLKWKYASSAKAKAIISDFAPSLTRDGGILTLQNGDS
jgi:hypothetical protein